MPNPDQDPSSPGTPQGPAFLRFVPPIMESLRELGGSAAVEDVWRGVVARLELSEAELAATTPSGQLRVRNQFHWARFYLKRAKYLEGRGRGEWAQTAAGRDAPLDPESVYSMFKRVHATFSADAPDEDPDEVLEDGEMVAVEGDDDTSAALTSPFDPEKIRVKLWTPTVDLVLKRIKEGEIDLAPDFQRAAGIWRDRNQSRLIESLLIRVPLPAFYVDGNDEDRLLVIDGIQRLTALKRFVIDQTLRLHGLEYLKDCDGRLFSELPRPFQRRIEETMLTVHVIDKGTPEAAKLNIFKRLNTGGEPLTQQEIRHAMSPGPVRDFLKALAGTDAFRKATQDGFRDDRMTDRECVLRFCAFTLVVPENYPAAGDLDSFLLESMRKINELTETERAELSARFERAMQAARAVLKDQAFRKPKWNNRRPPVNKALFEAWAIAFDARSDAELSTLVERSALVQQRFEALIANERAFEQAVSQGTGDPNKVRLRFAALDKLLHEVAV